MKRSLLGAVLGGLLEGELRKAQHRVRRSIRRGLIDGVLWGGVALIAFAALACFLIAAHLGLRCVVPPIAAWALTGGMLLTVALLAALILVVSRSPRRHPR